MSITELECLALIKATEHFEHYLVGKHFVVKTDHKPLEALQTSKRLTGRLARWALSLQHLNYTVQYKAGKNHQNADGMSRQAWEKFDGSLAEDVKLEGGGDVEGQPNSLCTFECCVSVNSIIMCYIVSPFSCCVSCVSVSSRTILRV